MGKFTSTDCTLTVTMDTSAVTRALEDFGRALEAIAPTLSMGTPRSPRRRRDRAEPELPLPRRAITLGGQS